MRCVLPFTCLTLASAGKEEDLVARLPGYDDELPSKHYSGYIPVAQESKMIHYYLQEADEAPESKPLLLWLNGGPGGSSLFGALTELGQLIFNRNSMAGVANGRRRQRLPTMFRNPHSWTTIANVLYFESPAGVGFSYCVEPSSPCVNNDTSTAQDNHEAFTGFLDRFPEFVARDKYLTGESYAGLYLPMLLQQMEQRGQVENVKGLAIGNGCWGTVGGTNCGDLNGEPGSLYRIEAQYYAGRGLISPKLKAELDTLCGDWSDPLPHACKKAYRKLSDTLGNFNIDNVDDFCPDAAGRVASLASYRDASWRKRRDMRASATSVGLAAPDSAGEVIGDVAMWCGAESASDAWMANPEVIKALHVVGGRHNFDYDIERLDLRPLYMDFAFERPGLNFLVYNGQSDANVPWNGQVDHWVPDNVTAEEEWGFWTLTPGSRSEPTLGHVRTYSDSFRFVTLSGAGHEVPTFRPAAALSMLKQFLISESQTVLA